MPRISDVVWPLVIVGRGSTAAYYVSTVDLSPFPHVLVIGEEDPWAGRRGNRGDATDPTLNINHPPHLLDHFSRGISKYSENVIRRQDFAGINAQVLNDEPKVHVHTGSVKLVSADVIPATLAPASLEGYRIDLQSGEKVYTRKVVIATGAGGHRVPGELKEARAACAARVLDLDEFANLSPGELSGGKTVVVVGPNAAIDAVHKALNYKMTIHWLIDNKQPDKPPILATQPNMQKAWDDPGANGLTVHRYASYAWVDTGRLPLNVRVTFADGASTLLPCDYIVYALGQTGATVDMIANTIRDKLKPIEDTTNGVNAVVGNKQMSARAIIGYEAEGSGLMNGVEVFGAISAQIGRALNNAENKRQVLERMILVIRKADYVMKAIVEDFPGMLPFLGRTMEFIDAQPRELLGTTLRAEIEKVVGKHPGDDKLKEALVALANLLLAHHALVCYGNLPQDEDPTKLSSFARLLNMVTTTLPRQVVSDSGQLTSINASIRAYATIRGASPTYLPQQRVTHVSGRHLHGVTEPGQVNWNLDSMQNIAIYIAAMYPNVPASVANAFIDRLILARRESPMGLTDQQVSRYLIELASAEGRAVAGVFHRPTAKL